MKNLIMILVLFVLGSVAHAQTKFTFNDDMIYLSKKVNGQFTDPEPFFAIGWYGSRGDSTNFNTKQGYLEGLEKAKLNGANVVLDYWNAIIDQFLPGFYPTCWTCYSYDSLNTALKNYLDEIYAIGDVYAIIHLPTHYIDTCGNPRFDPGEVLKIVNDPYIKNHPALFGWYHADEPELDVSKPNCPNYLPVDYDYLRSRYELIKTADSNHPVFVVFVSSSAFIDKFTSQKNVGSTQYRGPIFDILMADYYPANNQNYTIPHPDLGVVGWQATMLRHIFILEKPQTNLGAMMFVHQGYGEYNIQNNLNPYSLRNMHPMELFYATNASIVRSQDISNLYRGNISGLLYWHYGYADSQMEDTVHENINFYYSNSLKRWMHIESKYEDYDLVSVNNGGNGAGLFWWKAYQVKSDNDSLYINLINQCTYNQSHCWLPTDLTLNVNAKLSSAKLLNPFSLGGNEQLLFSNGSNNTSIVYLDPLGPYDSRVIMLKLDPDQGTCIENPIGPPSCPEMYFSELSSDSEIEIYPNPFNPTTTIRYTVQENSNVEIKLFNVSGQMISTIYSGTKGQGTYTQQINAAEYASGMYILQIKIGDSYHHKKVSLLK